MLAVASPYSEQSIFSVVPLDCGLVVAPVSVANAAVVLNAFAAIAESVADASAQSVAFWPHRHSVLPSVGALSLVAAGVFAAPGPASASVCPAVAGISGPASDSLYYEQEGVPWVADRWDELRSRADQYFPRDGRRCLRRDSLGQPADLQEGYTDLQLRGPAQLQREIQPAWQ